MLTRQKVRSMAMRLVPHKGPATVVLNANTASPETVNVSNAWLKPTAGGVKSYGGIYTEQNKTIIKILDSELNPTGNGREIRTEDEITFDGVVYVVTDAGGNLKTVRTTWDCFVQKKLT